jgi:hypothetical protein
MKLNEGKASGTRNNEGEASGINNEEGTKIIEGCDIRDER